MRTLGASTETAPLLVAFLLGPLLIAGGLLVAAVAIQGLRGSLARNRGAGIRTPQTLASDEAWDVAHRTGGIWMLVGAFGSIIPGIVVLFRPSNGTATLVIMAGMGIMVAFVIVGGAVGSLAASRLSTPKD
ncbi:MAG: putative membrane protein [Acidimicrobiales bacterium]|jgi:uncharacterized membrane protein